VKNSRFLILDEPCQDLDSKNRAKILDIVEQVVKNIGTTLIFVTHIPEIPLVVTHKLVLKQGRLAQKTRV
jgi:ABC-type molybdenum transport system ATPase subunit/photorepair protein PhrA